jgi:hypothetical protein
VCRHETSYQKKSSRTFYDTRTHFAALARACFHESHVWISHSCEYAAHVPKNASHIATLALDVPFPGFVLFFFFSKDIGNDILTRSRHTLLETIPLRGFSPPVPGSIFFCVFLWVLLRVVFRHFFASPQLFFRHQRHHHTSFTPYHHQNFVVNTS